MCSAPRARCADNGDKFLPGRFSVDKCPVVQVLSTGFLPPLSPCVQSLCVVRKPPLVRACQTATAAFFRKNPVFQKTRPAFRLSGRAESKSPAFFVPLARLQGACIALRAAFVACLLCILYLNSSSSRALKILWTTPFFPCLTKTCVGPNTVCPAPFPLFCKVHNLPPAAFSVDKCLFMPACSTALSTDCLWHAKTAVPPPLGSKKVQKKGFKWAENAKTPRRLKRRGVLVQATALLQRSYQWVTKLPHCSRQLPAKPASLTASLNGYSVTAALVQQAWPGLPLQS